MALQKVTLKPGFNKQATSSQAEGEWVDGDNVRFRYQSPEKIGGWSQKTENTMVGAGRALMTWSALDATKYAAIGTNKILALYTGDAFYDITPLASTVATCSITSTTGSSTVTIDKTSHGLYEGDLLIFDNVTIPAGCSFTTGDFTTNTFEVQAASTNSFNVVMTSTETGGGASAGTGTDVEPYEVVGPLTQTFQYGWGTGQYNASTWGTARTSSELILDPGSWSLDNFGQKLIATIHNGKTFIWDPGLSTPLTRRAIVASGNPTKSVMSIVSDRDRHLIQLGTETTVGNATTQDRMFVRFSDQEDETDYTPTSTNTAGTMYLDQGNKIIGAIQGKDYILILTDTAAYIMQYVGPPFTFSIRQVGSDCGAMGQHSIVYANGVVFWMGNGGGFFMFDGSVKPVPCLVEDFVFTTQGTDLGINYDTGSELVFAGHNALFNEVSWFYPQNSSSQVDRVVTYNYMEQVWTTGTLDRTTWSNPDIYALPFATQYDSGSAPNFPTVNGISNGRSVLYEQETGTNQIRSYTTGTVTTAISSSIQSGDFDIDVQGDGEYFMSVRRFIPDFKNLNGTANVTIYLSRFPNDTATGSPLGPFTVSTSTQQIWTRARSRLASFKIDADELNGTWRYGLFRFDSRPDGRR